MESSRPVDVPFGTFGQFRPIGHGQNGRNWPTLGVFTSLSCTGDISKTGNFNYNGKYFGKLEK